METTMTDVCNTIVNKKNFGVTLKKYQKSIKEMIKGRKEKYINEINNILNNVIDDHQHLIDIVTWSKTSFKTTNKQRTQLKNLQIVIKNLPEKKCNHKLEIIALVFGGGFCPDYLMPEIVCSKCGLNVGLRCNEDRGFVITKELKESINKWISNGKLKWVSSGQICDNFKKTYREASKFSNSITDLKIIDMNKFESFSHQ